MKSLWPTKKLGEICEERKEKNIENKNLPVFTVSHLHGLVPYQNVFYKQIHSKDTRNYKIVRYNNFVFGLPTKDTLPFGYLYQENEVLVSPAYTVFSIKEKTLLHPKFLFYLFKTEKYKWTIIEIAKSQSATRHGLPLKFYHLADFEIPLPPLPIQQKIVKILDTIQEAVEMQEKIIEKTKELKKSMMADLFKYGGPSFRQGRKLKKTEIGEIPENWEVVKLVEVVREIIYGISKKGEKEGKYPLLRMNNLENGKINCEDLQYVNLSDMDFKKFKLKKGDILFNRTNSLELVGKTALFDLNENFVFSSYLLRIRTFSDKLLPEYLNYYFNFEKIQKNLKTLASRGASQVNISASKLKNFLISLPSLSEQQEIAEILQTIDQKIEIEKRKKELYEELFKTMLNKIMNQEIDVENIEI